MSGHRGHIDLILGPMFGGKTSELINQIVRYRLAKKRTILLKYCGDTRYGDSTTVMSHAGSSIDCKTFQNPFNHTDELIKDYDVIGIDEGQFFHNISELADLLCKAGKIVIIAGLIADFQRNMFPEMIKLMGFATNISFYKAVCMQCGELDAVVSHRKTDGHEVVEIGGADKYEAICMNCYYVVCKQKEKQKEN